MSIPREEILYLARLARLELSPEEVDGLGRDLEAILDYAGRLEDAPPRPDGEDMRPSDLREDEVREGLPPGEATRSAPSAAGNLFRVPPVLGGDGA